MEYTRYFSKALKHFNGLPVIGSKRMAIVLNVVALEAKMAGMTEVQKFVCSSDGHRMAGPIFKLQSDLDNITGDRSPKELLEYLISQTVSEL